MILELLKKTSIYSVATMANRAMSVVMLPVYTRYLTTGDYGVLELLDFTVNLAALLIGGRIGQALFYFYFKAQTQRDKDKTIATVFFASLLLAVLCWTIAVVAPTSLSRVVFGTPAYSSYFRLVFFGLGFSILVEMGYCTMRTFGDSGRYVAVNLCYLGGIALLNVILLVGFRLGVRAMLTSSLIGFIVASVYVTWLVLKPIHLSFDARLLARLIRYSTPLGISGLAVFFIHYGDRIFLRPYVSLGELGVYSLAYKIGMMIAFIHAPFVLHWNSQVCAIASGPDGDTAFARSLTYVTAALSVAVVALSLLVQPGLRLLVTPAFYGAGIVTPWLAAAYLIRSLGAHLQSVFTAEGRPGIEARVNTIGSVACVAAYALLIPRFRIWGAVAATVVGFAVILAYGLWEVQRLRPFRFEYQRLFRIMLLTIGTIAAYFAVNPSNFWLQSGLALTFTALHGIGMLFVCFDSAEREALMQMVRRMRAKYLTKTAEAEVPV